MLLSRARPAQRPNAHAEQPDALIERHALQTRAGGMADRLRIVGWRTERAIPRHGSEVVVAKLDADCASDIPLALQIPGKAHAQIGEDAAKRLAIMRRV